MDNQNEYLYRAATHSKHALITGGAGFIGSHLAEILLKRGYWVTVIDDLSTGRFENIAHLVENPRFKFAIDTIMNEVVMDRLVSECETIYHLAAAVGVRLIVERPVHTIQTNVMGTEAVLRIARRYQAKVMIASTSEVYGKGNHVPFREDDDIVLGPTSRSRWSYAATKMVDEFHGLAYYEKYNLPIVIFRLFNTVGPRQTGQYGMVIPRFVEQALSGIPLTVYADGSQSRCFMHVQDAVDAIVSLAESEKTIGKVFNVGSTEEVTILDLARKVIKMINAEDKLPSPNDERIQYIPYEEAYTKGFEDMKRRVPDIQKIQTVIGWRPKKNLDQVLADVIDSLNAQKFTK
ncbi:MAG: GDP-mannose 4,6-dehydratase [Anaerolineales bacterium]|nr:GDP-mannose 4,6-dehydratase [Anaerolineales bacterium]